MLANPIANAPNSTCPISPSRSVRNGRSRTRTRRAVSVRLLQPAFPASMRIRTTREECRRCSQSRDLPGQHAPDEPAALHVVAAHHVGENADADPADHELARDTDIVDENAAVTLLTIPLRPDAFGKLLFGQNAIM